MIVVLVARGRLDGLRRRWQLEDRAEHNTRARGEAVAPQGSADGDGAGVGSMFGRAEGSGASVGDASTGSVVATVGTGSGVGVGSADGSALG